MSTSTDAILVYGIPLEEESIEEYDENSDDDEPTSGPAFLAHADGEEDGVCMTMHCSYDSPMFILSIPGTEVRAWRGDPVAIRNNCEPFGEWDAKLKAYCKKHSLKTAGNPGWWLCSMWG